MRGRAPTASLSPASQPDSRTAAFRHEVNQGLPAQQVRGQARTSHASGSLIPRPTTLCLSLQFLYRSTTHDLAAVAGTSQFASVSSLLLGACVQRSRRFESEEARLHVIPSGALTRPTHL